VSALSFRLATEADIQALLELRLAIEADQAERFGDDRYATTISEISVARSLKASRVLVATRRGRIVGLVSMGTKKPWAVDLKYFTPACKAVYLYNVDVSPELQQSGIGRQLIDRVKVMAKEWPVDAIRLDAYDGAAGAGSFYKKCGFKKLGHKVYRSVPLVYYEFVF
jgi:ribosomal protein S18 acetylase RimI-like enzyme